MPLSAYQEQAFKAFFLDVGLLAAKAELSPRIILEENRIFTEFKGALAEQYVQQIPLGDTSSTCRLFNLPLFAIHQLTPLL